MLYVTLFKRNRWTDPELLGVFSNENLAYKKSVEVLENTMEFDEDDEIYDLIDEGKFREAIELFNSMWVGSSEAFCFSIEPVELDDLEHAE